MFSLRCSGYFESTDFIKDVKMLGDQGENEFYDSNTGKLLYTAPRGRSMDDFLVESRAHGWPSFRGTLYSVLLVAAPIRSCWNLNFVFWTLTSCLIDAEVNWENVRVLPGGETVSVDGTHLGHNLVRQIQPELQESSATRLV